MKTKITYFQHNDIFVGENIKYAKITVFNEPTTVNHLTFKMTHVYNVPADDIKNHNHYLEPLDNPHYNTQRAFNIYRQKMGLLKPKDIIHARHQLHLSQRDVSAILGISYSTLSKIENNRMIQSISQDTLLRDLTHPFLLSYLILKRLIYIKISNPNRVNIQKLNKIAHTLQ